MKFTIIQPVELVGRYDGDVDPTVHLIDQPFSHFHSLCLYTHADVGLLLLSRSCPSRFARLLGTELTINQGLL